MKWRFSYARAKNGFKIQPTRFWLLSWLSAPPPHISFGSPQFVLSSDGIHSGRFWAFFATLLFLLAFCGFFLPSHPTSFYRPFFHSPSTLVDWSSIPSPILHPLSCPLPLRTQIIFTNSLPAHFLFSPPRSSQQNNNRITPLYQCLTLIRFTVT